MLRKQMLAKAIFTLLATGKTLPEVCQKTGLTEDDARRLLQWKIMQLIRAEESLVKATRRCAELARKIQAWAISGPYADDQPLEVLRPPGLALKKFHEAGIYTLAELRTVTIPELFQVAGFRAMYVEWAIAQLDERCLTHNLYVPNSSRRVYWREKRRVNEEIIASTWRSAGRSGDASSSSPEESAT